MSEDKWEDEGGALNDDYDASGDREPRKPKTPDKFGGAELELPKEEEVIVP